MVIISTALSCSRMFTKNLIYEAESDQEEVEIKGNYSFGRGEKQRCWFGKKSFSKHTLAAPTGIAIQSGRTIVYVCDQYRIQVYTMDGDFITSITHEYIISPWGIAVESDAILVTDTQLCALIIITDHKFIRMGGPGVGKSDFISPRGLDCDKNGNIYVADTTAKRIRVFTSQLEFSKTLGKGKLVNPVDVTVVKNSIIILLENKSVLVYSLTGVRQKEICINQKWKEKFSFITCINPNSFLLSTHSGPGHYLVSLNLNGKICKIRTLPLCHGILYLPQDQSLIVVSHYLEHKVSVFTVTGNLFRNNRKL